MLKRQEESKVNRSASPDFQSRAQTATKSPRMHRPFIIITLSFLAVLLLAPGAMAAKKNTAPRETPWADWIEPDFPFYSSTLDARDKSSELLKNNLTPRGLILNLGNDTWACFDIDLLRYSAIWKGRGITEDALSQKSYHPWGSKTRGGLMAPKPLGEILTANGIYPGGQIGEEPSWSDPRKPAPDPNEIGRGGLPQELGGFDSMGTYGDVVQLHYAVGTVRISEEVFRSAGNLHREFHVGKAGKPWTLVVGTGGDRWSVSSSDLDLKLEEKDGISYVTLPARPRTRFELRMRLPQPDRAHVASRTPRKRWPQEVVTKAQLSRSKAPYVVDDIELPLNNPWKRNVRPGDIQFKRDGTGVMVTLDGDVWLVKGLKGDLEEIRWQRYASGFHEPMSVAIRDEEIFVFDKNGIWSLGGPEEYQMRDLFSNAFGQTIDQREFPSTIRNAPDGEFVIAKGGQQKTWGKHNGSVLRISDDGSEATVLGYGFRQPAIGVNIRTGLVTSGDQEGQYIPSTPLHEVRDGQFYGYIDDKVHGRENYPDKITAPMTWMPHAVNASAISQVWLFDAKMGALNDQMVHIGFSRPELFKVMLNDRGPKLQAALTSITTDFQHPPLNGGVNPADGQMYVAGFQIQGWGNVLNRLGGMSRVRYTGRQVTLPEEVVPMDQGILIRFGVELDPVRAANPDNYSLATWHYRRTPNYGSAQYQANGKPGIDFQAASSAYLSEDGKSVFVGVPDMKPVMQLRIGWSLATKKGETFEKNAYTTPHSLAKFDAKAEGFGDIKVNLTPRELAKQKEGPVTLAEGKRLYGLLGCVACHSLNGDTLAKVGPTWMGLFESEREVVIDRKRQKVKADLDYLRESILDPTAKVVRGFEKGEYAMPSYAGVVTDSQIEALLLYIKGVKDGDTTVDSTAKIDASQFE